MAADAEVSVNGVRLGTDPTPVLHGDKIQIFDHEILAVDPQRAGNTQLFDSGAFADLPPVQGKSPRGPTGGRVVCLTDGREYAVKAEPLVFGRDAVSDVVVVGGDVSRRHAEIQSTPEGYVLEDLSVNGTHVNGRRIARQYLLARADVIRIGNDEFRFYADSAPVTLRVRTSPAAARRPAAHSDRGQRTPVRHDARGAAHGTSARITAAAGRGRPSPRLPAGAERRAARAAAPDHGAGRSTSAGRTTTIW